MSTHPADHDLAALADGALGEPRASEVRAHLEGCPACLSLVAQLARVATGAGALPPSSTGQALAPGAHLGRYEVLDALGAGAMGVVYSAHDPVLGRQVAIKVLRELGPGESERLLSEARILAQLNHPHVSAVYDAGHDGGRTYLAMQYLSGTSLRVHLLAHALSWSAVLALFRQAGEGLAAAHAVGIVQRDFKPDNVMVTRDGNVVVTDFGLATETPRGLSAVDAEPFTSDAYRSARSGQLIGTPAYMAPEQMRGAPADAWSDQFSFCVALFEALTGRLPYVGQSLRELAEAKNSGQRAPFVPRVAPPPGHQAQVERALARGLSPDPKGRFPSMGALLEALRVEPPRRRRGVAVLVLGLAVGLGALAVWRRPPPCAGAAEHLADTWAAAQREAITAAFAKSGLPYASTSREQVERALDAWARAWVTTRTASCEETYLHRALPEAVYTAQLACLEQRRLEAKALVEVLSTADDAAITKSVGAVLGLPPVSLCQQTNVLLAPVPLPTTPAMKATVDELSPVLAKAKALGAAGQFRQALETVQAVSGRVDATGYKPLAAWRSAVEAASQRDLGAVAAANDAFFACTREATEGRDDARAAECHLGLLFVRGLLQGNAEAGHAEARIAESLLTRLAPDWHLEASLWSNEASLYSQSGHADLAVPLGERAVTRLTKQLGPDHNEVARAETNLGAALVSLHRYAEAERVYRHALGVFERVLGPDHPSVALVLNNLVEVLASQKEYAEARATAERALAIRTKVLGPSHRQTVTTRLNLAGVQALDGHLEDARVSLEAVIAQWEHDLGPEHPYLGDPLHDLGHVLRVLGRADDALRPLERALALRQGGNEGPFKLAQTRLELAQTLVALHRDALRARGLAQAAFKTFGEGGADFADEAAQARATLASFAPGRGRP